MCVSIPESPSCFAGRGGGSVETVRGRDVGQCGLEDPVPSLHVGFAERVLVLCSWNPGLPEFLPPSLGLVPNFLSPSVRLGG